jgi:enoyl-[acyl-carrier-protein] reductase (NADH)
MLRNFISNIDRAGAAAITGQTIYVDCGYQIMGM